MPREYEYCYLNFDKNEIISKIKKLNGSKKGIFLFKVMVFHHPNNKKDCFVRIRDEGDKITLTYKTNMNDKFVNEYEIQIDNFKTGIQILEQMGCKKNYYYEKIREIWTIGDSEVVFDMNPGKPERMEVESVNKQKLDDLTIKLGLKPSEGTNFNDMKVYEDLFGFQVPKNSDLTFNNMVNILKPLVTKNKNSFDKLTNLQTKYIKRIL